MESMSVIAGTGLALYAAHHVGDFWIQTHHQAQHKGDPGWPGRITCLKHVGTYILIQGLALVMLAGVSGWKMSFWPMLLALTVSAGTHYLADRREHGLMFAVARWLEPIAGKGSFLRFGSEFPTLGTGASALDQSWHIWFGVFVPALILGWGS